MLCGELRKEKVSSSVPRGGGRMGKNIRGKKGRKKRRLLKFRSSDEAEERREREPDDGSTW